MPRQFRPLLPQNFLKNVKIGVSNFLYSSITCLNKEKKKNTEGQSLVETAWNAPYVRSFTYN